MAGISHILSTWIGFTKIASSMILVQIFATGMQLLSVASLGEGTFVFALLTYRHLVAAICVSPLAFYFESGLPMNFNWKLLLWLFINALTG
ncbi:hypothetical protein Q3G72_004614 [Acer saccharum]|nr:hypothetical protein Q3G72_004614 [Acer saccharum]